MKRFVILLLIAVMCMGTAAYAGIGDTIKSVFSDTTDTFGGGSSISEADIPGKSTDSFVGGGTPAPDLSATGVTIDESIKTFTYDGGPIKDDKKFSGKWVRLDYADEFIPESDSSYFRAQFHVYEGSPLSGGEKQMFLEDKTHTLDTIRITVIKIWKTGDTFYVKAKLRYDSFDINGITTLYEPPIPIGESSSVEFRGRTVELQSATSTAFDKFATISVGDGFSSETATPTVGSSRVVRDLSITLLGVTKTSARIKIVQAIETAPLTPIIAKEEEDGILAAERKPEAVAMTEDDSGIFVTPSPTATPVVSTATRSPTASKIDADSALITFSMDSGETLTLRGVTYRLVVDGSGARLDVVSAPTLSTKTSVEPKTTTKVKSSKLSRFFSFFS